jgi:hypothetical protein
MLKQGQITLDIQITGSSFLRNGLLTKNLTENLTDPDADADAGVTTVAGLFFFEKSS